jgi:DNA polymerase/3'-5' exonuclease PolX
MGDYRPREEALTVLEMMINNIKGHCERIEIAGSIRREKDVVHDAEIVVIPKPSLWHRVDLLLYMGVIEKAEYVDKNGRVTHRWGEKFRSVVLPHDPHKMKIEIYTADPHNFGYIYWLRTGPAGRNEQLVTTLKYRSPFLARESYIWLEQGEDLTKESIKISVPDEATFFRLLNLDYEQPKERGKGYDSLEWTGHRWGTPERFVMDEPAQPPQQVRLL